MVTCPVCNWSGDAFLPFGNPLRTNVKCPNCGSKERHRYLYLYLKTILPRYRKIRLLHIAPEESLRRLFVSDKNINYLSIDLYPDRLKAMKKEDLTQLSFPDKTFDIIFCSHVLEHISSDTKAMQEIHRVLNDSGFAIIQVPIFNIKHALENKNYGLKKRIQLFGQKDHLRAYGRDFKDRLKSAGFKVKKINFLERLDKKIIEQYRLVHNVTGTPLEGQSQETIYYCTR